MLWSFVHRVSRRKIEGVDIVDDLRAFFLPMRLFFRADEMSIRMQPSVRETDLPVTFFRVSIMITVHAQTERAATNRYSPLGERFRAAGDHACE